MTTTTTKADLDQFRGSEKFYRHGLVRRVVYTEGVQFLAQQAGCYWLLDTIAGEQLASAKHEEFQVWTMELDAKGRGIVRGRADAGVEPFFEQTDILTDFPAELSGVKLIVEAGGFGPDDRPRRFIMLLSER